MLTVASTAQRLVKPFRRGLPLLFPVCYFLVLALRFSHTTLDLVVRCCVKTSCFPANPNILATYPSQAPAMAMSARSATRALRAVKVGLFPY